MNLTLLFISLKNQVRVKFYELMNYPIRAFFNLLFEAGDYQMIAMNIAEQMNYIKTANTYTYVRYETL